MKYSTETNKKIGLGIIGLLALAIWSFANSTPSENNVSASDDYKLVFSDEFNLPDGSQPDSTKWRRCNRYAGLWSRWISDSRDVVYIKNGCLVCRAVPNRKEREGSAAASEKFFSVTLVQLPRTSMMGNIRRLRNRS